MAMERTSYFFHFLIAIYINSVNVATNPNHVSYTVLTSLQIVLMVWDLEFIQKIWVTKCSRSYELWWII